MLSLWRQDCFREGNSQPGEDTIAEVGAIDEEPLSAAIPNWGYEYRFQKAGSQVWTPRPEIKSIVNDSMTQWKEDEYAYSHFFYGLGGGTFLEMGTSCSCRAAMQVCCCFDFIFPHLYA